MGTPGVKARSTHSNHVVETERCLGIEAARTTIQSELRKTYGSYGEEFVRVLVMVVVQCQEGC